MEINLTEKQKIFLEGILRSCAFLILMRELFIFALEYIVIPAAEFLMFCASILSKLEDILISDELGELLLVPVILIGGFAFFISTTYVLAKLCGINKYFSQFKFWKSLIFLIIISTLAYYFCSLNLHTFKFNFEDINSNATESVITIIPSYLTYLFFNFLTKKFPTPFEQIGYFFSNKFYIDLFKKIRSKFIK